MRIVGITGLSGAGKGTVVEILQQHGRKHYSARTFLGEKLQQQGLPVTRDTLRDIANALRAEHGPAYIIEQLYEHAHQAGNNAVIESIRAIGEVDLLRKKPDFILLAVDASQKVRYERIIERGLSTDHIDFETFVAQENKETRNDDPMKQNIAACIAMADIVIPNDGTVDELHKSVEVALAL